MTYTTYFEIGGHVIESNVESRGLPGRPPQTDVKFISKKTGVPAPLLRKAGKEVQEKTGYDPVRAAGAYGRLRRARWAIGVAGTLAMADGPLPIGDALAVGFLATYGIYEGVRAFQDIRQ